MLTDPMDQDGQPSRGGLDAQHASELQEALRQRTTLLHEVDHRVKNNLQLIASLLLLQSRRIDNPETRHALRSMLERVNAIATVHRQLFKGEDLERFDVAEFIRDQTTDLARAIGRPGVSVHLDLEPVVAPASQAAALALVVNEVVGNALKHAFPNGRTGAVSVSLRHYPDRFDIVIADDGIGELDAPAGFGGTIITLLSKQLRATSRMEDAQPGRRFLVSVPMEAAAQR